jgi:hypothetical protein
MSGSLSIDKGIKMAEIGAGSMAQVGEPLSARF